MFNYDKRKLYSGRCSLLALFRLVVFKRGIPSEFCKQVLDLDRLAVETVPRDIHLLGLESVKEHLSGFE